MSNATVNTYDAVGNLLSVTDPEGNETSYQYDRLDRQVTVTDPLGNTSTEEYDADGNVIQNVDRDGRVTDYLYDPLNRQVEEDWMSGETPSHTIQSYYDAAGELVGVAESDTQDSSNATCYKYSYDGDGRVLTSRMAPGDLAQSPTVLNFSGNLTSSQMVDWNHDGTKKPYATLAASSQLDNLPAGQTVLVLVTSSAFATALFVQPPNGSQSNWLIATHTDGKSTWFIFTVGDSQTEGQWLLAVTSTSAMANGLFSVQVTLDPSPFVPTALTELDYTYYADGSVETCDGQVGPRVAQRQGGHHDLRL